MAARVLARFRFGGKRLELRAWDTWVAGIQRDKENKQKVELFRVKFGAHVQENFFRQWKKLFEQSHSHRFFDDAVRPHLAFVRLHLNT